MLMSVRGLALSLLALTACAGSPAKPPEGGPEKVAVPTPAESDASTAPRAEPATEGPVDAGTAPSADRRIREGSAVTNANPDDLPYRVPAPAAAAAMSFDDAKGAPPPGGKGTFRLWHESGTWHLQVTAGGAKPPAGHWSHQARIAPVTEASAESPVPDLHLLQHPFHLAGADAGAASLLSSGFDLATDGAAHGVTFKVPPATCFTVTLRSGEKQELPSVAVGAKGRAPKVAAGQDTLRFCP